MRFPSNFTAQACPYKETGPTYTTSGLQTIYVETVITGVDGGSGVSGS